MRKHITLAVLIALVVLASQAFADHEFNVKDKINMMKTDLSLTDDQVKAIKPILQDYKNQLDQLNKQKQDRLGAVLSPEQMNKMQDIKKNKEKMK